MFHCVGHASTNKRAPSDNDLNRDCPFTEAMIFSTIAVVSVKAYQKDQEELPPIFLHNW